MYPYRQPADHETPARILLLPSILCLIISLKKLCFNFLEASYADILDFGIHVTVGLHTDTSLSIIKKKKRTMMHRISWEEKEIVLAQTNVARHIFLA